MALRLARAHHGQDEVSSLRVGTFTAGMITLHFNAPPPDVNKPDGIPEVRCQRSCRRSAKRHRSGEVGLIRAMTTLPLSSSNRPARGSDTCPPAKGFLRELRGGDLRAGSNPDLRRSGHGLSCIALVERRLTTKIMPDLTSLAKVVAGGYPGAAVVGRAEIIDLLQFVQTEDGSAPRRVCRTRGLSTAILSRLSAGIETLKLLKSDDYIERANKTAEVHPERDRRDPA